MCGDSQDLCRGDKDKQVRPDGNLLRDIEYSFLKRGIKTLFFQQVKREDLLLFFFIYDVKLNICWFCAYCLNITKSFMMLLLGSGDFLTHIFPNFHFVLKPHSFRLMCTRWGLSVFLNTFPLRHVLNALSFYCFLSVLRTLGTAVGVVSLFHYGSERFLCSRSSYMWDPEDFWLLCAPPQRVKAHCLYTQ